MDNYITVERGQIPTWCLYFWWKDIRCWRVGNFNNIKDTINFLKLFSQVESSMGQ